MEPVVGSSFPHPPAYYSQFKPGVPFPKPPDVVRGEYTTFGVTGNSSVSLPKLQGQDLANVVACNIAGASH
jgi:hypothetical protein